MTYTYKKIIDFSTKKESTNTILRKEDNAFIPINEENKDYQDYLEWVNNGGVTQAAD